MSQFKQLRPRTRVYTDSNGISELLLCIYGKLELTLPVPLLIWIPRTYPLEHPLIYIDLGSLQNARPSVGVYVNPNGVVSLPIFAKWHPGVNNILQVIQELFEVCNHTCLVEPLNNQMEENVLPHPPIQPACTLTPNMPERPPIPPKPSTPIASKSYPINDTTFLIPPKVPVRENDTSFVPETPKVPPSLPKRPPTISIDLLDSEVANQEEPLYKRALTELQMTLNQMDTMEDRFVKENFEERTVTIKSAIKQFEIVYNFEKERLKSASKSIDDTRASLEREIVLVGRQSQQVEEYERTRGTDPDPSSLAATETVVLSQLYQLVAKDYALSDAIHALARLLNRDTIKLDMFVKKTRELAREQFLTRTHIQKVVSTLGK